VVACAVCIAGDFGLYSDNFIIQRVSLVARVILEEQMTKHFLKTLIMFTGMIILGLVGVFLVSYFDEVGAGDENQTELAN
jgi:hypothetical protein